MGTMLFPIEQKIVNQLTANWVWVADWIDSCPAGSAGRIVTFTRKFTLTSNPSSALLHFSADTRYKLFVNRKRVAVGPTRSSSLIWYHDNLDIAPFLHKGDNEIVFVVLRYFASVRAAMPFVRTILPGLTVCGVVNTDIEQVDLTSKEGWEARVNNNIEFPTGLRDDVFLHINERLTSGNEGIVVDTKPYNVNTLNGELAPWRLRPRPIPMPEETPVKVNIVRACTSVVSTESWEAYLSGEQAVLLPSDSSHVIEVQAEVHSTAFLRWVFKATKDTQIQLKITYSEGYELEPRSYPFVRSKADRLDASNGKLIGPCDEINLKVSNEREAVYEPFWFRTFRLLRLEITVGSAPVELVSFTAMQTNYPLAAKAAWKEPGDRHSEQIWEVSVRTMRNCMFDGYSDCPFYEQLQYSCDSRSVGLFHYLLSGDDRLMRQTLDNFAASVTAEGLTQSRFPSYAKQIIAGFSLYWILQICDHHLFFGDTKYTRSFLPRIDGVLDFFDAHVDQRGLVSSLPSDVWQYVDWVTVWGATDDHPDKGVPISGRKSNLHTYFSMLYAYVLKEAANLLHMVGRPAHGDEYMSRAECVLAAVRKHCYDGRFFTDSTADMVEDGIYSQHCQAFAVLSGAAQRDDCARLLTESFGESTFSKCSYMMQFYVLRAFAVAGDDIYEGNWKTVWNPWRDMLAKNLSTWEEDDVRQRSDCHAWGSVPIYEYCTELAGIRPIAPGASKILFKPRLRLSEEIEAKVALGKDNFATVNWKRAANGAKQVKLHLSRAVEVISKLPGQEQNECGMTDSLTLVWNE